MKVSMTIICSVLVFSLCAIAESRGYGYSSYPANASPSHYRGSSGCSGYGCGNRGALAYAAPAHGASHTSGQVRGAASAYGPYHSYAVRPVVYGGHGLYNYRGYARHGPAAPVQNTHHRYVRSYPSNNGNRCSGYNCHAARAVAPQQLHYGWRPVKALAIAPAATYSDNYAPSRGHAYGRGSGAARGQYRAGSHGASAARYQSSGHYNRAARHHNSNYGASRNHGSGGY